MDRSSVGTNTEKVGEGEGGGYHYLIDGYCQFQKHLD